MFLQADSRYYSRSDVGASQLQSKNEQAVHDVEVSKIEQKMLPVILPVSGTVIVKERLNLFSIG